MNYQVENPFGFGKYHITGEKANTAGPEFEKKLEELTQTMTEGSFTKEFEMFDGCNDIIKEITEKYNVKIELVY